ncbi:MAG: hypothetical protein ACRDJ3_05165 [Solirubrobacteraceae bacterium]
MIADRLAYEPASLFKPRQDGGSPFDALIEDIAEHLLRREVEHRVTEQRMAQRARRSPLESAMRVDWLPRFERYYTIWSYVAGVRNDLTMALASLHGDTPGDTDYFVRKSLYYHACFLTELERFTRDRGGLWVLPDPAAEQTVADAVWMIRKPTPLTEFDESILRLAIAGWGEIATFVQATHTDTALVSLVDRWREWIGSCGCHDPEEPQQECQVHRCLSWVQAFMTTLDGQWDLLADWYEVPRPQSVVPTTSC